MSQGIAPHILALAVFLSLTWGVYLLYTINDYLAAKGRIGTNTAQGQLPAGNRRRGDVVAAFRRMVVALCVWSLPFSIVFRTASVLFGMGEEQVAQITFFALAGPNVVGSIFAAVSVIDEVRDRWH